MLITLNHLQFYREHKVARPAWAAALQLTHNTVSIHTLINAQVPDYKKNRIEPQTLIHLVRLVQSHKAETVKKFLYRLATNPSLTDSKRRVSFARTWYAHLVGGKKIR